MTMPAFRLGDPPPGFEDLASFADWKRKECEPWDSSHWHAIADSVGAEPSMVRVLYLEARLYERRRGSLNGFTLHQFARFYRVDRDVLRRVFRALEERRLIGGRGK